MDERRGYIVSAKYVPGDKTPEIIYEEKNIVVKRETDIKTGIGKAKEMAKRLFRICAAEFKKYIGTIKPLYKKTVATILLAAVAAIVFCAFLSLGFDAYINNSFIGTVRGYEETDEAISDVNTELYEMAVEAISAKPSLYMRIVGQNSFTDGESLRENVKKASGALVPSVAFKLNGEQIFCTDSFASLTGALKEYGSYYGGTLCGIAGGAEIENVFCYENEICSRVDAVGLLKNAECPVITKEVVTIKKEIEKPVKIIEDNTKREPYRKVEKEGKCGESEQTVEITRVGGEETNRVILSENTTVMPIEESVIVGTLPPLTGRGSGTFLMPAKGEISSYFGKRWGKIHKGLDIAAKMSDNIVAADEGKVIFSGTQESYGKVIIIDHQNGYTTRYAHCSKLYAKEGELVGKGDLIAAVGNTGNSTGPHLHFEIRKGDTALDPLGFVNIK